MVVSVGGVRSWQDVVQQILSAREYGRVVQHLQLVVSLSVGGVRSRCPCSTNETVHQGVFGPPCILLLSIFV